MSVTFTVHIYNAVIYSAWAGSVGNLWKTNTESPMTSTAVPHYLAFHQISMQSDKSASQSIQLGTPSDCSLKRSHRWWWGRAWDVFPISLPTCFVYCYIWMGWAAMICLSEAASTHGSEVCAGHIWQPPVLPATTTCAHHTSLISKPYPKPTQAHTSALSVPLSLDILKPRSSSASFPVFLFYLWQSGAKHSQGVTMEQGTIQDFQRKAVLLNNLLRQALAWLCFHLNTNQGH